MANRHRKYNLDIWMLGLGFYLFYTPYSGLTKALSTGLLAGTNGPVRGVVLLPASAMATVVGMLGFITLMGWWKYAGHRNVLGVSIPFPRRQTFLSGICMATIMGSTTLAFTFGGLSIVLVLVLLRGGTLTIAPIVDGIVERRVRWFSWAALLTSLLAVAVALGDAANYTLTIPAIITIAAYLVAYFFKLQFMSRLAKSGDRETTLRYFVEEQMIASPLLVLALAVMALIGVGDVMMGFRIGLTSFLISEGAIFAASVGLFYAGLCICTTLIFLDRRENTFCMPMHCGSSMLSGFTASAILAYFFSQSSPSLGQTLSAALILIALGFLSPLHHFDRLLVRLKNALARLGVRSAEAISIVPGTASAEVESFSQAANFTPDEDRDDREARDDQRQRLFLFVCSGNTCRSPMAAAIASAEIAFRMQIPFEALSTVNARALSAGVAARVGAPLTAEAEEVLRLMEVPVKPHAARNLTTALADQAEIIFCLTSAQRQAVIEMIPKAAGKTLCLDAAGDIDDPIGRGMAAYLDCARRIRELIRLRFDDLRPPISLES